jgi:hypothetical protein
MAAQRIINRNYACHNCGKMRRAPADYVPGAPPPPKCCGTPMQSLSYEATIVATRLSQVKRLQWLKSGGQVVKASGRRRWKRASRAGS